VTLFWLKRREACRRRGTACFITDYLGAVLTGEAPVTDPTMGASSGLFHLAERRWDSETIRDLGLPLALFPEVREAGERWGRLTADAARMTDLPASVPVFVGLGDNQASFLGSVAYREDTVQVNIGTGGQVGRYTGRIHDARPLETRPFPGRLPLGRGRPVRGRSYATLRQFSRDPQLQCATLMHLYARTGKNAPAHVRCEPFFTGTRRSRAGGLTKSRRRTLRRAT
jgi:sugar (pentulose or hexulose) kinase